VGCSANPLKKAIPHLPRGRIHIHDIEQELALQRLSRDRLLVPLQNDIGLSALGPVSEGGERDGGVDGVELLFDCFIWGGGGGSEWLRE
jgi:hypothetical protein